MQRMQQVLHVICTVHEEDSPQPAVGMDGEPRCLHIVASGSLEIADILIVGDTPEWTNSILSFQTL